MGEELPTQQLPKENAPWGTHEYTVGEKIIMKLHVYSEVPNNPVSGALDSGINVAKNLQGKDRQRQLWYYVNLIRACKKVLYQLVYMAKKFIFLKEPLYLTNQ